MTDFLGQELHCGDEVVAIQSTRTSATFVRAEIVGFTPKNVKLRYFGLYTDSWYYVSEDIVLKDPRKIIKTSPQR